MEPIHRRDVLRGAALGAFTYATTATGAPALAAQRGRPAHQVVLNATVFGTGSYAELPFTVPRGVQRIDVAMSKSNDQAKLGIGLFDHHGTGYQSPGFRGVYGEERSSFFVSTSAASDAFMPGPMGEGTWTTWATRNSGCWCRCSALPRRQR